MPASRESLRRRNPRQQLLRTLPLAPSLLVLRPLLAILHQSAGSAITSTEVDYVDSVSDDDNESDEECVCVHDWNPDLPPSNINITSQPVYVSFTLTQQRLGLNARACVDSGANISMSPSTEHVIAYTRGETEVTGMSGPPQRCPNIKLGIPTVSADGEPLLLEVPGPSLLNKDANCILLSHGSLQKARFHVKLRSGTRHNPLD
mmetsp:Transcript_61400/g.126780  ORF Transcript_61400/g.126780 Transcript_61400/m.126780 type:complete len:204 (-) Transcript_61400:1493-2104(-)